MYCFKSSAGNEMLMRTFTLRHAYEEARAYQKSKTQQAVSNCIIIRKDRTKNETDFGYKEELKTNILKKMHFIYLQSVEDLITFLWKHSLAKESMFGVLTIENIEQYFGQHFEQRECGVNFLIFIKLLKQLSNKIRIKGRVSFSYCFDEKMFHKSQFEELIRGEDATDWEIESNFIMKNGERYESEQTKSFFMNYLKPDHRKQSNQKF